MGDDSLMVRLQGGDSSAFDELTRRHRRDLVNYFRKHIRDLHAAEDLAQETLLRIYTHFWSYMPGGQFRGWLYRIARNLLIDAVRRNRHAIPSEFPEPEASVAQEPGESVIERCVSELPSEQGEVFRLFTGGMRLPEVATRTGVSLATCKGRLRLARQRLASRPAIRALFSESLESA